MFSNRLVFAILAVACFSAAGLGGYIATRHATAGAQAAATDETGVSAGPTTPSPESAAPAVGAANASVPATALASSTGREEDSLAPPVESSRPTRDSVRSRPQRAQARQAETTGARRRNAPEPHVAVTAGPAEVRRTGDRPAPADTDANPSAEAPVVAEPAASAIDARDTPRDPAAVTDVPVAASTAANDVARRGPDLEELVVAEDSVIGLHLQHGVSSETARVEDEVDAKVVRDVRVDRRVAIPAGSRAIGSVTLVERGGRFKDRARLGIRFHTLVLGDGSRLPISTDTIYRYGDAQGDRSAKKIGGGAVAGAILGAIIGGARGAAVGATAGAGGGTAMVMAGERSAAEFPSGSDVTARILSPVSVTVER